MSIANFRRSHDYLICIDSDGCVFDTMELKHKECFIPAFIKHYGLQGVSRYAREAAEFVNLYSRSRGANRFPALLEQLDWLRRRPELVKRGFQPPDLHGLRRWIADETHLGNPALSVAVEKTKDPDLKQTLDWSLAVNAAIAEMVRHVPPFPCVRESLRRMVQAADSLVVSATPSEALHSEWQEHGLSKFVQLILGQECGSKRDLLSIARLYPRGKSLMIGDAPGDHAAAIANDCLFFPVIPGHEIESWSRLYEEGLDRFFGHTFDGDYQHGLIEDFDAYLPTDPPWPVLSTVGAT